MLIRAFALRFCCLCVVRALAAQAPSAFDGYGSTAFSTVGDAILVRDWRAAQEQLQLIGVVVRATADWLLGKL